MDADRKAPSRFRQFFFRGLGILLPTVLTIWILVAVFQFVDQRIAQPINLGVQRLVLLTPWPRVSEREVARAETALSAERQAAWQAAGGGPGWLTTEARRMKLMQYWNAVAIGTWVVADLIGVLVAVVLIYVVGAVLGSMLGKGLYQRIELWFRRLPVVKAVYPHVKQVTDFMFGEQKQQFKFNRVLAVQYPRRGLWSVGLVTGHTMRTVQDAAGVECVTVFVPSAPTPFTGWVITVPVADTIELPITIDEAVRFMVTGGLIVPDSQAVTGGGAAGTVSAANSSPGVSEPTQLR